MRMENMKQQLLVGIFILLIIVGMSGCVEDDVITVDEIKEQFLQTIEDVLSYKWSANVTVTTTTINETGTNITVIEAIQNGEVDIAHKKLKVDSIGTTVGSSEEQHWISYIIDTIAYTGTESQGCIQWSSYNTSYSNATMAWIAASALEGQARYLQGDLENTTIQRLADEVVGSVDCYVLYLTAFINQSGGDSGSYLFDGNMSYAYELTYWIAKDTYFLIKAYSKTTSDMSGWYAYGGADRTITISEMSLDFYDYDIPVIIEGPPEEPHVQLMGFVTDAGSIVIEHIGGDPLPAYRIDVKYVNDTLIDTTTYQNEADLWEVGESKYLLSDVLVLTEDEEVRVTISRIYDDGSCPYVLFDGILRG
jgi:hypothetical protein